MDAKARALKEEVLNDMREVRTKLYECSNSIRSQKGVGCEFCADKLDSIADRYKLYINVINGIN